MKEQIKVIGFDADDTLWVNEPYYRETERLFAQLMSPVADEETVMKALIDMEVRNIPLYGYGAKGFMLSMIETVLEIAGQKTRSKFIEGVLTLGKTLLAKPVVLLDDAQNALQQLKDQYRLVLVTKGDLLDQERKLRKSGLHNCFHHIEILSDKKEENYQKLLQNLSIEPEAFMMVGNSLKSDVIPALKLGAWGVYIPYHTSWVHERTDEDPGKWRQFLELESLSKLANIMGKN
ncbi:MAG: HAD family hydrolase [Bacteroidales bacterium]|nr:HAD family hydrolase [Bacteroidales bacterium]